MCFMLVIYEMWLSGGLVASSYLERLILCLKRLWFGLDLGGSPLGSLPPDATGLISVSGSPFSTGLEGDSPFGSLPPDATGLDLFVGGSPLGSFAHTP